LGDLNRSDLQKGVPIQKRLRNSVEILTGLANALQSMHEKEYVHRDIKPDNVCVKNKDGKWEVKLIDFGMAKRFRKASEGNDKCGSVAYMAPEVEQSGDDYNCNGAIDVFSFTKIVMLNICLSQGFLEKNNIIYTIPNLSDSHMALKAFIKSKNKMHERYNVIKFITWMKNKSGNTELCEILMKLVGLIQLGVNADPSVRPSIIKFKFCLEQLLKWLNENEDPFKGVTVKAVELEELRTVFKDESAPEKVAETPVVDAKKDEVNDLRARLKVQEEEIERLRRLVPSEKAQPPAENTPPPVATAAVERQIWPLHVYIKRAKKFLQTLGVASGKEYSNLPSPLGNDDCDLLVNAVARVQLITDITLRGDKTATLNERESNAKQALQKVFPEIGEKLKDTHSAFTGAFLAFLRAHGPDSRKIPEAQLVSLITSKCFDPKTIEAVFYLSCINTFSNYKKAERTSLKTLESTMQGVMASLVSKLQSTKTEGEAKIQFNESPAAPRPVKRMDALKSVVTETVSVHKGTLTELAST